MNHSKIFVAGHQGLVGSAIVKKLKEREGDTLLLRTRRELDLSNQAQVVEFFSRERPSQVYLAAARVGGIQANSTRKVQFLYENLMIAANVIHAAATTGVKKLLFLGSSCIYPKFARQPVRESDLLTGPLEPTNEGYAIAKIAGLKLCEYYNREQSRNFISAMPTNLYGPNDNFDHNSSHVIPGMIRKFHEAKRDGHSSVAVWGTGSPLREFLYSEDLAEACLLLMEKYSEPETINIGSGSEITIRELAHEVKQVVGFQGEITFDSSRCNGAYRKALDSSRIQKLGWKPKHTFYQGLRSTYAWAETKL